MRTAWLSIWHIDCMSGQSLQKTLKSLVNGFPSSHVCGGSSHMVPTQLGVTTENLLCYRIRNNRKQSGLALYRMMLTIRESLNVLSLWSISFQPF